jgi:hypothetical protein
MSPLQKIAMGLVVVVGFAYVPARPSPSWAHYDVLADPLGWVLVLLGTVALTRADPAYSSTRWLAALAGLVSVPMWFPQLHHRLDASGEWFASLPQLLFCLFLAREIGIQGTLRRPPDTYVAKRFGLLVWGFAIITVLPVLALGGGLAQLEAPTQLASLVVNVALVWFLFRVHGRPWLGGRQGEDPGAKPVGSSGGTHEGRPPSS